MEAFTRYLAVRSRHSERFLVSISQSSPIALLRDAMRGEVDLRYSPILPAYLVPGQPPPPVPDEITSLAFFFSRTPYSALGSMKPEISIIERECVYFTQGLASIVCVNCELPRARELLNHMSPQLLEYWPIRNAELDPAEVTSEHKGHAAPPSDEFTLQVEPDGELAVYLEQILACIVTLRQSYAIYNPGELRTLDRVARFTEALIARHGELTVSPTGDLDTSLRASTTRSNILSALAEIGASLSYAVTQGASGSSPILANRSPFPHFSLLGIGSAVRAITNFTRYLELAFAERDVSGVIEKGYSCRQGDVPARIAVYSSGDRYKFSKSDQTDEEEFDRGGDFHQQADVPLILYFSARHGFKESKFALTAASEALTAETAPQWTLMTLSHEVMHNRVREIFQTLLGSNWGEDRETVLSDGHYLCFREWIGSKNGNMSGKVDCAIRNAILNFCCAMDRALDIRAARRGEDDRQITMAELCETYRRHRLRAMELFVHFHDYYFAYACQPMMYTMSLWASWVKIAAPYSRPMEYLVRTLATIACGTGLSPEAAFAQSKELLDDALCALTRLGMDSPLFNKLRNLMEENRAYALFKPSYYLTDQARRFFASRTITRLIDRIDDDPFAEGSTSAGDYSANPFVYGDGGAQGSLSPIRYSLASFLRSLRGEAAIADPQWMTAWNTMVISSQEARPC